MTGENPNRFYINLFIIHSLMGINKIIEHPLVFINYYINPFFSFVKLLEKVILVQAIDIDTFKGTLEIILFSNFDTFRIEILV